MMRAHKLLKLHCYCYEIQGVYPCYLAINLEKLQKLPHNSIEIEILNFEEKIQFDTIAVHLYIAGGFPLPRPPSQTPKTNKFVTR